ncbi:MAG: hypothetical protein ABJC33_04290 [Betaproteobacteria bacterium]
MPVVVGIGVATQREDDPQRGCEPLDLMLDAVRRAASDTRVDGARVLAGVDRIAVPKGRWRYQNPAGAIARAIGAKRASTVLAAVGVLQQTLLGDVCHHIAEGEIGSALVLADVSAMVAGEVRTKEILEESRSDGVVAGYTVLHPPSQPPRGVVVADIDDGRAVVHTEDRALVARMESIEFCGARIRLRDAGTFAMAT